MIIYLYDKNMLTLHLGWDIKIRTLVGLNHVYRMGPMKKRTQKEIDDLVISQTSHDKSWGEWSSVNPSKPISIRLSEKTISSLKLLSKLKREKGYQTLLKKWIDERLIYEQRILMELRGS